MARIKQKMAELYKVMAELYNDVVYSFNVTGLYRFESYFMTLLIAIKSSVKSKWVLTFQFFYLSLYIMYCT